jgi:TolB-like protein
MEPAIFISYASDDEEAVARLCTGLRDAGLQVWFDRNELRGGDAWDASIRTRIKECAIFVPVISANTEARGEGYFRLEWKLGVDRSHLMADDQPFLVPVAIDDTREATARVPGEFRARHWMRLPGGVPTPEFVDQVKRLLRGERVAARREARASGTGITAGKIGTAGGILIALVAVSSHYLGGGNSRKERTRAPATAPAVAPNSVAVLPFATLSDDGETERFSDGITEELLIALPKMPGLQVAARSPSLSLKGKDATAQEIGRKLGVAHLVEGSVRRSAKTVRIAARLTRTSSGEQLWSEAYTRDVKDVLAAQSELAEAIAKQVRDHIAPPK